MSMMPVFKLTPSGQVFLDDTEIPCVEAALIDLDAKDISRVQLTITVSDVIVNYNPFERKDEK